MRILHVNKFLYRRGGAEGYMEDVAALQREAGHEVAFWGMDHPENVHTTYERFFPRYLEFEPPPPGLKAKADIAARMLWSTSAKRGMAGVIEAFRPDVAHLHNVYHQLSPSILRPLAAAGVPAVMTLHDYKLACPTYQFLDHGQPCEACLGGHFHHAVRRRCKNGSLVSSTLAAVELTLHTRTGAYGHIGAFVCPSRFLRDKMVEAGVYPDRMRHIPHFVDHDGVAPATGPGTGVAFGGRLSPEKGVDTLIDAVGLDKRLRLRVAGDGPIRAELEERACRVAPGRIEFLGRVTKEALADVFRAAAVVAMPSRWYENQPMTVLEAYGCGRPVVGTALGGTPELVDDGVDGALVPPEDPTALASALARFTEDPATAHAMGAVGRGKLAATFAPGIHVQRIDAVYAEVGARPSPRREARR